MLEDAGSIPASSTTHAFTGQSLSGTAGEAPVYAEDGSSRPHPLDGPLCFHNS